MKKVLFSIALSLLHLYAFAQCDTTGILLELQATTNIEGLLMGQGRCIKQVKLSGLSFSSDTLKAADNQQLSISGNQLTIQRGNTVTLPSGGGSQIFEDFGIVTGTTMTPAAALPGAGQEWRVNLYRAGIRMTLNKDYIISSGSILLYLSADAEPFYLIVTQ